jgi:hypothetical protein
MILALVGCDDAPAPIDAAPSDAASLDAQPADAALDAQLPDAQPLDAQPVDAQPLDAMPVDAQIDAEPDAEVDQALPPPPRLVVSEVMAKNEGAWVDEHGHTDDWIELQNLSDAPIDLTGWHIGDDPHELHPLPPTLLLPGAVTLLWADDEDAPGHLPFKVSASGESLYLHAPDGQRAERVRLGTSAPNDVWGRYNGGWQRCGYATPEQPNGATCGPPPPPELPEAVVFDPYPWPEPTAPPLVLTELALNPAGFIEVLNTSDAPIALDGALTVAPHAPGLPWPTRDQGVTLPWPEAQLAPGARLVVPVPAEATAALTANGFEGVVTLWPAEADTPLERVDFMAWPAGAALSRPTATGRHRFCAQTTPGAPDDACDPLASRPIGERLRHLRTPGDYAGLAEGGTAVGTAPVKWIMDLEGGGAVHLLATRRWDLHYTFVREAIEHQPSLSRCDPEESALFRAGWRAFSDLNYREVEGRRYLLGTLVHHGGADLRTVEHTSGDAIIGAQMQHAFFGVMAHVLDPTRWVLRAQTNRQIEEIRGIEGTLPAVGPNAPYHGVTFQALTPSVGYGVLTWVPVEALERTPLGPQVIVVTDQVPNDIGLTAGLITEAFQTPLAHVNLLSRNRDTPNMALVNAHQDPRIAPLLGTLVRLEVSGAGFSVRPAEAAEAEAFWLSRQPQGPRVRPRLNTELRGVQPLSRYGINGLPVLGAKAAQLAELARVTSEREPCVGPVPTPATPMAVPLVHSLEHYEASGARALLTELEADPQFRTDPAARVAGLARVRALITQHPVDPTLLRDVEGYVAQYFRAERVRFRSSSNTEDLPGFNGAGLYTSISGQLGDPDRAIDDALRTVWASLWAARAYDEREAHHIDQTRVAMGVLVHPAFLGEQANGVAISRNVLEPIRAQYYLNTQIGEASVANPAPGVGTEQVIYDRVRSPRVRYLGRSTLARGGLVLTRDELDHVACTLRAIHEHFEPLIDPEGDNPWFAMDIELKLIGDARDLVVKQARPYSFGAAEVPQDCREL